MRFEVLGPLTVRTADGAVVPVPEPKVRALLANLLVRQGRPAPADALIDDLWGERLPANPSNSLQTKVSQLRRVLEKAEPGARELVAYGPAGYLLRAPEGVPPEELTDAAGFVALTSRAYEGTDPRQKISLLSDALTLWRGEAYADFRDAEFARVAVTRLEEQRLTAQEVRAELRLDLAVSGEHAALADELAELVAGQPLRERLRGAYMRALYLAGRPTEALDAYRDLRERLADDLGIDPGPELAALHEALLRQDPALAPPTASTPDAARPAPKVRRRPPTNLPAPVTTLVGRDDAVARVRELVRAGRLVTLTGPGGVGKTRLALEAAAGLAEEFDEGVWLVELAGTKSDVAETVAATLGIRDAPPTTWEDPYASEKKPPNGAGPAPSGNTAAGAGNLTSDAAQAAASDVAQPAASGVTLPAASGVAQPAASGVALPVAPGVALPVAPGVARPAASDVARPAVPGVAPPAASGVARPVAPGVAPPAARVATAVGTLPPGAEPSAPDAAQPAARVATAAGTLPPGVEPSASRSLAAAPSTGSAAGHDPVPALGQLLAQALAPRRLLLVLDNCEHVLEPVAALLSELLRRAPGLRVLATSQESLALSGETLEAVAPLEEDAALALFAERAAAAAPGFVLDAENTPDATLICRRLDGIPLAVELAATRVRALGVHALAERLHDRFRLLNQVRRDAPARQRTLRAMIDWSWELLTGDERAALRQLAVCAGGFTLAAAEAVHRRALPGGEPAGPRPDDPDVLDLVTRLLDRSLLTTAPTADPAHGIRYRMLESVTAYSLERLDEAGETKDVRRRHAQHYAAFAESAAPHLLGPGQRQWLHLLDAEAVNLRSALEWAVADGDATLALRLVDSLTWYWFLRGRLGEAVRSLTLALSLATDTTAGTDTARLRASARTARAALALLTGDDAPYTALGALGSEKEAAGPRSRWLLAFARSGFVRTEREEAEVDDLLAEFRAADDRWGVAATLSTRATRALYRGDLPALRRDAEAGAVLFGEIGDRWGQLQVSEQLGVLAEIAADYKGAAGLHRDGMRGAEELELWTDVSFRLARLGRIALLTGDDAAATDFHERAARLAEQHSHRPAQQFAETGLAIGARRLGEFDTAEKYLLRWLAWNRRLGVHSGEALVLAQLGYVAEERGDAPRAEELHREGLAAARASGDERAVALALEGLAGARSLARDHHRAAELLGAAAALRESVGSPLPPAERRDVDRAAQRSRGALGDEAFVAAYTRGHEGPTPN